MKEYTEKLKKICIALTRLNKEYGYLQKKYNKYDESFFQNSSIEYKHIKMTYNSHKIMFTYIFIILENYE